MKYFVIALFVFSFLAFVSDTKADSPDSNSTKKQSLVINAGFFLVPQGEIVLTGSESKNLFKAATPLFLSSLAKINKLTLAPFYLLTNNSMGLLMEYQAYEKLGCFLIVSKSTLVNGGKIGYALTTPLAGGKATGFIEVGHPWSGRDWKKSLSIGVIIPFVTVLKE
jgi:hypothetical protein